MSSKDHTARMLHTASGRTNFTSSPKPKKPTNPKEGDLTYMLRTTSGRSGFETERKPKKEINITSNDWKG